ncbi:MAG: wax ester/triacylglycerol synthase family O-acyltransferase [Candidatus Limnocylindria bacterium]
MASADAAWLHMDQPTNLMVVNGVLWFDEPLDLERLRATIRERLVERFPRFRQRVVEPRLGVGVPAWEDHEDFDLDLHLHHLALPEPGDRAALERLASELVVAPLDPTRPLWDMYLVDGYGSGSALIARMHHCIADGIALARVLLSLTDEDLDAGLAPTAEAGESRGIVSRLTAPAAGAAQLAGAAWHEGLELVTHPRAKVSARVTDAAASGQALAKLLLTPPDTHTTLKGRPGVRRRLAWSDDVSLDEVKRLGHATGTTVNDVLVTAMAGALRHYLMRHNSLVDEIRVMVPFNLRPLDQPLPRELGNRFGLVELDLPVGIGNRRERLAEVHRRMNEIKHSPEGVVSYGILGAVGRTPRAVERRLVGALSRVETAVLTNVPGPRQPVYLAGTRVVGVLAWVPTGGSIGIGISIFSYDGRVIVGLQTAASLVPDPDAIVRAFLAELRALERLKTPAPAA